MQASLGHSGNKGTSLETTVQEVLGQYLPKSLGITSGEITDVDGNSTKQFDVIIYDAFKAPILFEKGDIRVIPIECVYAVIEIKAEIASQDDVDDIFANMQSIKNLEKTCYYKTAGNVKHTARLYGKKWDIWPVHYFVFSIKSMKIDTLANKIHEKHVKNNSNESHRIDCVCVLEKGVIFNELKQGTYSALPEPGSIITWHETQNPLLFFYVLISRYMNQAWMPNFNFAKFTKNIKHKAKTIRKKKKSSSKKSSSN